LVLVGSERQEFVAKVELRRAQRGVRKYTQNAGLSVSLKLTFPKASTIPSADKPIFSANQIDPLHASRRQTSVVGTSIVVAFASGSKSSSEPSMQSKSSIRLNHVIVSLTHWRASAMLMPPFLLFPSSATVTTIA